MSIEVRSVAPDELDKVGDLVMAAYSALRPVRGAYEEEIRDVAERAAGADVLVAVEDGELLGTVTFVSGEGSYSREIAGDGEAEFRMLAVDPAAQRRGVGRALVQACLDRARALGCTALVICTRDFTIPAHKLYERFGFVRMPERDWSPMPGVELLALRLSLSGVAVGASVDQLEGDL